jgi:hypothetical protein
MTVTKLLTTPSDSLRVFEYTSDATIACFFLHRATGDQADSGYVPSSRSLPRAQGRSTFSVHINPKYRARHRSPDFLWDGKMPSSWSRLDRHDDGGSSPRLCLGLSPKGSRFMPRSQPAVAVDDSPSLLVIVPHGPRRPSLPPSPSIAVHTSPCHYQGPGVVLDPLAVADLYAPLPLMT